MTYTDWREEMQKAKRKRKDRILIGTTTFMFMMSIMAAMLWAFHKPLLIYEILCMAGLGWCMAFSVANGGDER